MPQKYIAKYLSTSVFMTIMPTSAVITLAQPRSTNAQFAVIYRYHTSYLQKKYAYVTWQP